MSWGWFEALCPVQHWEILPAFRMASSDTHFIMVILPIDMPSSAIVFSTVTRMLYLEQKIKVFDKAVILTRL